MFNKKLLILGVISTVCISTSVQADLTNWYQKKEPQVDNSQPTQAQQPVQNVQSRPDPRSQYSVNQPSNSNQLQNNNGNLEARMNDLNTTIENLNKLNSGGNELSRDYLNIVQFIVINETTKMLDGQDNRGLINNMLAGVVSCQNKYKVNVMNQINSQLPREVASTVQKYLSQNSQSIPTNAECLN